MFKIYINETPLYLTNKSDARQLAQLPGKHLLARYANKSKILLNYADMMEKGSDFDSIILYFEDPNQLFEDFKEHYQVIEAAGGMVVNESNELLIIFRRGHIDLPKGKIEPEEQIEEAAIREVEEETGVSGLKLGNFIQHTYHFYRDKNHQRALKLTHWFIMSTHTQDLIPQEEEDIEAAQWLSISAIERLDTPIYGNIRDLIDHYKTLQQQ